MMTVSAFFSPRVWHVRQWLAIIVAALVVVGCASTEVDKRPTSADERGRVQGVYPANARPVTAVLPLALGLSSETAGRYPHLVEKSVGLGVYQLALSAVTHANRFRVVEIRPENIDAILQERWLQASGLMSAGEAVVAARPLGAVQVIYGRIYDYAETGSERIVGVKVQRSDTVMVGVQLICTDVASRRQIGLGSAIGYGDNILAATRVAVKLASKKMIDRLFEAGPAGGRPSSRN
ncbi:hypothetical protein DESC_600127 [Desulfosarcina cetonica]|uniref:hypothetical protein n=1 Tax=Desulfosarcina cetonica TaxID=90730 RepID=UPI0006D12B54|nr:hypothetical protein [Desulfosarcina cetonica]VTR67413.1 hypothetical protein DESC_600127 [Desulfosarcina cetonica]